MVVLTEKVRRTLLLLWTIGVTILFVNLITVYREKMILNINLNSNARIFCMLLSHLGREEYVVAVEKTWSKHCTKHVWCIDYNTKIDLKVETIISPHKEGRNGLLKKVLYCFQQVWNNYPNFDYYIKADDDTFVIMGNLKKFINEQNINRNKALIFGRRFKLPGNLSVKLEYAKQGYLSGGAGYVMTNKAMEIFQRNNRTCYPTNSEDVSIGICASMKAIKVVDTIDDKNRERFFPVDYQSSFQIKKIIPWIVEYNYHPLVDGPEGMSAFPISFHYVRPESMYILEEKSKMSLDVKKWN